MSKVAVKGIAAVCSVLLIALALNSVVAQTVIQPTSSPAASSVQPVPAVSPTNSFYKGTNQSTSQVGVTYSQSIGTWNPTPNTTQYSLNGWMNIYFNDGTGENVGFGIQDAFNPGGLDTSNGQVLNWNELNNTQIYLNTGATVNGTSIATHYSFTGFNIINGTANDFTLSYNDMGNGSYDYIINNIIGSINYANTGPINISAVTLSTVNATYNGQVMTESVATFNVTFEGTINDFPIAPCTLCTNYDNETSGSVPVVLMFQITHDTAHTEVKYGVDINWSAEKDFPTATEIIGGSVYNNLVPGALKNGDNFSLVAQDRLEFSYGGPYGQQTPISTFSTNAENDSAIYLINGTAYCTELFPTNYTINGNPQLYNTTRIYIPVQWQSTWNQSAIFVVYGGFKYNQSTGFTFDPAVITPNSVVNALNILTVVVPVSAIVVVAAAIAIVFRRHKRTSTLKETSIKV